MSTPNITQCRECGSKSLSWDTHYKTDSGVQQGRLRTSEVKCMFVLGCGNCSETLAVMSAEALAAALSTNAQHVDQKDNLHE